MKHLIALLIFCFAPLSHADTEPPFFPVIAHAAAVNLPADKIEVQVQLSHPWMARAHDYRVKWKDVLSAWLPATARFHLEFPLEVGSVGNHHFEIQMRDSRGRQSAPLSSRFEVKPPTYMLDATEVKAVKPRACVIYGRSDLRIEFTHEYKLPKDVAFEVRVWGCANQLDSSCRKPEEPGWQTLPENRIFYASRSIPQTGYNCDDARLFAEVRDPLGFSKIIALPVVVPPRSF